MQVHILRHGSAETPRPGAQDADRRLTQAGREQLRRVLERARVVQITPTLILSSPYIRAVETAEMAGKVFGYRGDIVRTEALVPSGSPAEVWAEIQGRRNEAQILMAGHEPLLSRVAAYLLNTPTLRLEMRKAMLVRIDVDHFVGQPQGVLQWILPPEALGG
jgi:phosphohistidine phosphatase